MKKRLIPIILAVLLPGITVAQSVDEVRNNPDYLYGEGFGRSLREADNDALQNLISKISVSVESDFSSVEEEVVGGVDLDSKSAVKSVVSTYSQATLQNTERIIIREDPDAAVFRYVKRSEVTKIFESRKTKLLDMVASAEKAEKNGKIDDALRYYYWSYCLLQSLPSANAVAGNEGQVLVNWIPVQINNILDDVQFVRSSVKDDYVELKVLYKGKPATSLDYTYFDGMNWSNLYSARDGMGIVEMRPGASTDNIRVKCEYEYAGESHIDKEIEGVVNVMRGRVFRDASKTVANETVASASSTSAPKSTASKSTAPSSKSTATSSTSKLTDHLTNLVNAAATLIPDQPIVAPRGELTLMTEEEAAPYKSSMDRLTNAIRAAKYDDVKDLFTEDGLDMFNKLIAYGKARVIGEPEFQFMAMGDEVSCRSLPLNFSFKNNDRQFIEHITFTFNKEGKIDCLAFGLDNKAADDILHHAIWGEYARKILTEFLENYKTAYSLKRIDYLRQVFDDNAVIITGKVMTRPQNDDAGRQYLDNHYVKLTRQSKEEYLRNLEMCFKSNEFINIRFAENDVVKAGVGGEVYGIQIKQDYYSSNYGDTGYLFLMVDLNDPKQPIIKVRVWQPERDPDFRGLPNF